MKTLDMMGQPCPIPVVNAKQSLAEDAADGVIVLVDNFIAVQNLEKMAKGTGCTFSYTEEGAARFKVTITKGAETAKLLAKDSDSPSPVPAQNAGGLVALITADSMGRGADELGRMLIKGFIYSLTQLNPPPQAVIFLNGGAHLTTRGANTVEDLKTLEKLGTEVFTCGTCANYYKLSDALAVGSITDMMNITKRLAGAGKVITL